MTDMESMYSEQAKKAADNFIFSIKTGEIRVEKRPNHGKDFRGGFEKLFKNIFENHLSSSSRYLINKRIRELKYYE